MENEVSVYKPTYVLRRFDDEEVKITPDQYNGLETALLDSDVRFIKVGDTIINANSIKEVIKIEAPNGMSITQKLKEKELTPEQRQKGREQIAKIRKDFNIKEDEK